MKEFFGAFVHSTGTTLVCSYKRVKVEHKLVDVGCILSITCGNKIAG